MRHEMARYNRATMLRVIQAALAFDGQHQLPRIDVPTLILLAAENCRTHAQGRQMAQLIPRAHLEIIPRAHHLLNLDNPEAFNRSVLAFLSA